MLRLNTSFGVAFSSNQLKLKILRPAFLVVVIVFSGFTGWGQNEQTFTTSGTFTVPAGVTSIQVECWGGGGGGGGNNSTSDGAGGGGGGGYSRATLSVISGNSYTVTVGSGGTGGTGAQDGSSGGSSWFGSTTTILAYGGNGGEERTNNGGDGGTGAGLGVVTGTNTARYVGGNGAAGNNNKNGVGGGAGSSAGTSANGNNASSGVTVYRQTGASAPLGGGDGASGDGDGGSNGSTPGGGGAGAGDKDFNLSDANSGGNGGNGQVKITPTPSCATPGSPENNAISFPVNGNLTWNSVSGATGYRLYFGTDAAATNIVNGTDLGNVTTYNPPADLNTNTTYYWKVVPYNSIGSATGCQTWGFETEVFAYCSASSTEPTVYESITNVTFAGINNSSPVAKTVGYSNYSSSVSPGVVYRGQDYVASVTEQFLADQYDGYCKIFIDFNQNGIFDLPDEYVFGNYYDGNVTMTGTISIPVSATLGITRMRVVLEGAADNTGALPCSTFDWGEVEDYSINILQPCTNATLTLNTANNNQTVCVNSSITDISYAVGGSATGAMVTGLPAGVTGTFSSGIFTISGNPTETGAFSYTVTTTGTPSGCSEATATGTITVNALPTAAISDNNSPLCAGDNAEFYLTGTIGAVVTYTINSVSNQTVTLTGGTATITITNAQDDQTLTLVSVANGACSQPLSVSSTITVNPLPTVGSFN
jgi:hypothetical protein